MSRYDDDLWELVPDQPRDPPAHIVAFVRSLGHVPNALDVGCGDGILTRELQADQTVGTDVSDVALERAARRLPEVRPTDSAAPLELFGDNQFDLVLCAETLEHVRDVQLLLSEIRRVLRPGGRLAVTTPAVGRWHAPEHPFSPHIRFFTKRTLREALEATGFEVVRLQRRRGTLLAEARR